jgi:hypothetical protein
MPNTNNLHGTKNILLDNEDWMVVDPLDYDSFVYYAPEVFKSKWDKYRDGDTYFIIDKDKEPIQTSIIHKEDDKFFYIGNEAQGHRKLTRNEFIVDFPDDVKLVVKNIIGDGKLYSLLIKIQNGEYVSKRELEDADELIYDFKYTPKAPFKSKITLRFYDDDYIRLFNPSDDDMWYYLSITGNYDTYEFENEYQVTEDFQEGYIEQFFSDENLVKLKQILLIILPDAVELDTDEKRKFAGEKLYDMFQDEIDNIISDYVSEINQCKSRTFEKEISDSLCNQFFDYGIFTETCLTQYFTSVGMLTALYETMGDTTLTIKELLFKIGSDMDRVGWGDYIYEYGCDDFDDESLDRYVSDYLDKIIDKLDDNSLYHDIHEYSELYKRLSSKYNLDGRYFTKNKRDFFYRGIDPKTNRILIQVFKKEGGLENRSYTEEEFNNFLVSPELFEGFIRIN